jgi:3-oxoacyl-[acyl-carrier-protein] synthase-1/3-oxoacyl-[acyl-carrier-protein] synthase II
VSARASVIAIGALSPLGKGEAAFDVTGLGAPAPVAVRRDEGLAQAGFARPFCARVDDAHLAPAADRADALLDVAADLLLAELADTGVLEGRARVGIAIGTSSGGMRSAERFFEARTRQEEPPVELARAATYFAPFRRLCDRLHAEGMRIERTTQIVNACAASTWALGVGLAWLRREAVDVVIAGGYDALGPFVAAGFEALRATGSKPAAPFRLGRDGMALGEGAGLLALVREGEERGKRVRFVISGFGASSDAVHITAPDRTGDGLARAAQAALADAEMAATSVGLVSAHATATPYNDAMESRAIRAVLQGDEAVIHPMKAQIGHALGAAGVLETLAAGRALEAQVAPAAAGTGEGDPDAPARLLAAAEPLAAPAALKLSAAFGGMNAALVVERAGTGASRRPRALRKVFVKAVAATRSADAAAVSAATGIEVDKLLRIDELSLLGATAVARLGRSDLAGGGIVLGHALATVDINERFYTRILAKGPTAAEPRLFPPTSPNLMPGQIAILFKLTGPSAATVVGPGGGLSPLALAAELVASGAADRVVACSLDLLGPASSSILARCFSDARDVETGAVAALVDADPEGALQDLDLDLAPTGFGHLALARFLGVSAGPA